jgi:hypothetical protein
LSGRKDSNLRPLAPHASTLAGLRYAPIGRLLYHPEVIWQGILKEQFMVN